MAVIQAADHRPVLGVQRGEQAGRPVTQVVVGALLGLLGHHQKTPAGKRAKGLHLAPLIHAIHDRGLGPVQLQANHVIDLLYWRVAVRQAVCDARSD